jgi:hypothetical protein
MLSNIGAPFVCLLNFWKIENKASEPPLLNKYLFQENMPVVNGGYDIRIELISTKWEQLEFIWGGPMTSITPRCNFKLVQLWIITQTIS